MAAEFLPQPPEESDLSAGVHLHRAVPLHSLHPLPWKRSHTEVRHILSQICALLQLSYVFIGSFADTTAGLKTYSVFFPCFQDPGGKVKACFQS